MTGAVDSATLRRVSRRLIPFLFLLYVAAYLDRINVGFAQLQMKSALGFGDAVYGLGAGIFFIGYFLFEVPSNLVLARVGARVWIARIMITWGLISGAMAFVETPTGFYVLRFLLGAAEAGFFPGVIYYLGLWFPARERAAAVSRFMTATAIAGVIGAPLSAWLFTLDGVHGIAGWQWIFLAEAVPSLVLGVAVLLYLTDRPDAAVWLSSEQRAALAQMMRAEADTIAATHRVDLRAALLHPIVWRLAVLYFALIVGFYSISFWAPQIIQSLGALDRVEAALVSAIPYVCAAIAMVFVGAHSDRTGERRMHIALGALVGALGMVATAYLREPVLGVAALSVAAIGIWSAVPVFWSLPTTFLSGTAAAGAIALINSFGNLGGFVGPYVIGRVHDATDSYAAGLLVIAGSLLGAVVLALSLRRTPAVVTLPALTSSDAPRGAPPTDR
ncbi:MAG TPA: MFS transporter [Pseudomonadales bacterium]|nr:MFS transporter [Pseudomonadales bacterium]